MFVDGLIFISLNMLCVIARASAPPRATSAGTSSGRPAGAFSPSELGFSADSAGWRPFMLGRLAPGLLAGRRGLSCVFAYMHRRSQFLRIGSPRRRSDLHDGIPLVVTDGSARLAWLVRLAWRPEAALGRCCVVCRGSL